jgi:HSP20 family molecular chaperone IbpA
MRMRYRAVLYHIEDGEDLRHHYQQLIDELVRQTQTSRRRLSNWRPPTDIHETADAFLVKMELAGMTEDQFDVTLYADAVVIRGVRDDDLVSEADMSFHEAQIRYGPFEAAIPLPGPIERDGAEARYANGFLRLRLPKRAPERLQVQNGAAIEITPKAQALPAQDAGAKMNTLSEPIEADVVGE